MQITQSMPSDDRALWNAAIRLANVPPNLARRRNGPSSPLLGLGLVVASLGGLGLLTLLVVNATIPAPSRELLMAIGTILLIVGIFLSLWAGDDKYVRGFTRVLRAGLSVGRVVTRVIALVITAVVLTVLLVQSKATGTGLAIMLMFMAMAIFISIMTLENTPPIVSVSTKTNAIRARGFSLLTWLFAWCVAGTVVGATIAHRLNTEAAWPTVTFALAAIFISAFTQHHRETEKRSKAFDAALAAIYLALTTSKPDKETIQKVALDLESSLAEPRRGPFSLPLQPLIDTELHACLFYGLEMVSGLKFVQITDRERQTLAAQTNNVGDFVVPTADLAWEIRSLVLHARTNRPQIQSSPTKKDSPADGADAGEFDSVAADAEIINRTAAREHQVEPVTSSAEPKRVPAASAQGLDNE